MSEEPSTTDKQPLEDENENENGNENEAPKEATPPAPDRKPSEEFSLYVGNIPTTLKVEELKELFTKFGEITEARIPNSKGYGFVIFQTKESADNAIQEMNKLSYEGKELIVEYSNPRNKGRRENKYRREYERRDYDRRRDYGHSYGRDSRRDYGRGYDRSYDYDRDRRGSYYERNYDNDAHDDRRDGYHDDYRRYNRYR